MARNKYSTLSKQKVIADFSNGVQQHEISDSKLVRFVKKQPFATVRDVIKELKLKVSENTVRRRLDIAGLFCYRAVKKPFISEKNRKARLEFAHVHKSWRVKQWSHILWSDESKCNLRHSDGKINVRCPKCKRLNPSFTRAAF